MMIKYTYKILFVILLKLLCNNSYCSDNTLKDTDNIYANNMRKNCQADASVIQECLQGNPAELHFFWTAAREIEFEYPQLKSNLPVHIGGAAYARSFQQALDIFLSYIPSNLTVHFVCDLMTRQSNTWLLDTQSKYSQKFKILDIKEVTKNVCDVFPSHHKIIKLLFDNATNGNPVIASDVYRLIGITYGDKQFSKQYANKTFTYCDIDTFCHALGDIDHKKIIPAWFGPAKTKSIKKKFCVSYYRGCNDIIKTHIIDLLPYQKHCEFLLTKWNDKSKSTQIFNYHLKLQQQIIECAQDNPDKTLNTYSLDYLNQMDEILHSTGPEFIKSYNENFNADLDSYPHTCAMEWQGAFLIDGEKSNLGLVRPEDKKHFSNYSTTRFYFQLYCARVMDTFYARRLGENHPFYVKMLAHLSDPKVIPFTTQAYKSYVEILYLSDEQEHGALSNQPSKDLWYQDYYANNYEYDNEQKDRYQNFYTRLQICLKKIGITMTVSKEDIML